MALRKVVSRVIAVADHQLKAEAALFNPLINKNKGLVNNSFSFSHHHHYFSPAPPRQVIVHTGRQHGRHKHLDCEIVHPIDDLETLKHLATYAVDTQNQRKYKGLQLRKIVRGSKMVIKGVNSKEATHMMYYITLEAVDNAGELNTYYTEIYESGRVKGKGKDEIDNKAQQEKKKYNKMDRKENEKDVKVENMDVHKHKELMLWYLVDDKSFCYPFAETRLVDSKSKSAESI